MRWGLTFRAVQVFGALLLLSFGVLFDARVSLLVGSLDLVLLLLLAVDGLLLLRQQGTGVTREPLRPLSVGASSEIGIRVGAGSQPLRVHPKERLPAGMEWVGEGWPEAKIPAKKQMRLTARVRALRRGRYTFGELSLHLTGPLGLLRRRMDFPLSLECRAMPDLGPRRLGQGRRRIVSREAGSRVQRVVTHEGEFERLRDYVFGDDPRHVDWKSTARRHRMMVRAMAPERSQRVLIVLDAGRTMGRATTGGTLLDACATAAMRLAVEINAEGDQLGLLAWASTRIRHVPMGRGPAQLQRVGQVLAELEDRRVPSELGGMCRFVAHSERRRALVVVLTELGIPVERQHLERALPELLRRHRVLVVDVLDPGLDALASTIPDTLQQVYESVAAAELLEERRRVAAHLESRGIPVLAVSPDQVSSNLVDRYLSMKRASML